jgi:C-terminal processing protease CtpA/Prc
LFAGKRFVLTDAKAISYGESVMGYMADEKLAQIVGAPTAGTNGNTNTFLTPTGYRFTFTGMRVTRHDGTRFHLTGVQPTTPIKPTLEGIRAGQDEVLLKALNLADAEGG